EEDTQEEVTLNIASTVKLILILQKTVTHIKQKKWTDLWSSMPKKVNSNDLKEITTLIEIITEENKFTMLKPLKKMMIILDIKNTKNTKNT
ncbi:6466_t:CDS:1, partial [Gigaspora margarita]